MTGNTFDNQATLARTDAPDDQLDPLPPYLPPQMSWMVELPPEVRRVADWIIGTGLFPDPETARRWRLGRAVMPRPWLSLTSSEFRARALAHFTAHLTGDDEHTRQQRADVLRALESLIDDPGDDNPILSAGCGTMTAARVAELRAWVDGHDPAALDRRAEGLRAVFEADEAYRERVAEWRAEGWELLPCFGGSPYGDRPRHWFVGKRVKVGFRSDGGTVEHMWVAVNAVEGRKLVGELVSEPVLIRAVQPGDRVELKREHVEAVAEGEDDS